MSSGFCDFCQMWHSATCCHPGRQAFDIAQHEIDRQRADIERLKGANEHWAGDESSKLIPLYTHPAPAPISAEPPEWLVELCMLTEAITPTTDIRGTVERLISYHVGVERDNPIPSAQGYVPDPERIKHIPAVSNALDEYAAALKAWGTTDNTPHRVTATENAVILAIIAAAPRAESEG